MVTLRHDGPARLASDGEEMARCVIHGVLQRRLVRVDFEGVRYMTPSFANALMMTLMESLTEFDVQFRVQFANWSPDVKRAMDQAAERYSKGIRLSTQRTPD